MWRRKGPATDTGFGVRQKPVDGTHVPHPDTGQIAPPSAVLDAALLQGRLEQGIQRQHTSRTAANGTAALVTLAKERSVSPSDIR
jgi:hypothetical protein